MVLKEGVAVAAGDLVSLEILDASRRVTEAGRVVYQATG